MRPSILVRHLALLVLLAPTAVPAAGREGKPIWDVPGDVPAMMAACRDIPELHAFIRSGYLAIECGYQAILLGSRIPIAPAPHVPWAKPYAKGPLRVLAITMFGNSPADTVQLAQVARELDCDMRFVLVAHVPIGIEGFRDEGYRLGFLARQAREALKLDYDVILCALGSYSPGFGYPLHMPIFPDDVYDTILAKVRAGTGLVLVGSNMGGWWVEKTPLLEASPATRTGEERTRDVRVEASSELFQGAPLASLTKMALYRWQPREGARVDATESGKPLVITRLFGKGRVVLLGWDGTLSPVRSGSERLAFEHGMAVVLRAVVHAADADPPVAVRVLPSDQPAGRPGGACVSVSGDARLECTLRDSRFETLFETTVSAKASPSHEVELPPLPVGSYWLDVIARDRKGASLGWGSGPIAVRDLRNQAYLDILSGELSARERKIPASGQGSGPRELDVATEKDVYKVGDTVKFTARVKGRIYGPAAEVAIRDATGRLLAQGPMAGTVDGYSFAYAIADARVAPHDATVTVSERGKPLLRVTRRFYVPNFAWTDYENILWPDGTFANYARIGRDEAGLTAVLDNWGRDDESRAAAPVGIRPARMNDAVLSPGLMQKDPAKGETENDEALAKAIEAARKYGSVCWAFQDERHCTDDPGMPNAEGLRRFREYLKGQYGSVEPLNASWDTQHKRWEDILPTLTRDLKPATQSVEDSASPRGAEGRAAGIGNLAPWLDFRLYVADQCFQADRRHAEMVRKALGDAQKMPIGIDGFTSSNHVIPYGGVDIGRLLTEKVFDFYCPYGDDLMIASMVQGPMVKYIGWGQPRTVYFGQPWRDAFRGHWGTFRFFGPTFFSQFGWTQPAGRWIEEGTRELRAGVGKLLMGARRQLGPVAILYSYPSMIATAGAGIWVEKGNAHLMWRPANWSRDAFEAMLLGCGQSFGYLTEAQVERGALRDKKLLVIPHFMGIALREETCAAIRRFVAEGGLVVADLAPAVLDGHGRLVGAGPRARPGQPQGAAPTGGLDDLFGVTRDSFGYAQRTSDYLVGVTEDDLLVPRAGWWIGEWYERGLKVTDGKALGKHWFQDVPALVAKQTGRGRALLLNFLHTCSVRRNGEPEDDDLQLMEFILRAAGVKAQAAVETDYGKPEHHCEINVLHEIGGLATEAQSTRHFRLPISDLRFQAENLRPRSPPQSAIGIRQSAIPLAEYVGVYAHKMPSEDPAKVVIRFSAARETYDVRAARYLGKVDRAALPLKSFEAALFARLDYRVTGVSVSARSARRGGAMPFKVEIAATAPPGRHVVHLEITDPDGNRHALYSRNVEVLGGKLEGTVHTALSDPRGTWRIIAREVISGIADRTTFRLR